MSEKKEENKAISRRRYLKYSAAVVVAAAAAGGAYYYSTLPPPTPTPTATSAVTSAVTPNLTSITPATIGFGPMWWSKDNIPNWQDLISEFEQKYPYITVKDAGIGTDPISGDEMMFAAGKPNASFQMCRFQLEKYVKLDRIAPLNDVYDEWNLWDKFYPGTYPWNSYNVDLINNDFKWDKSMPIYGVSDFAAPCLFYYDQSRFDEVGVEFPKTLADLLDVADTMKKALPSGVEFMVSPGLATDWLTSTFGNITHQVMGEENVMRSLHQMGHQFLSDDWRQCFEIWKTFAKVISPKSQSMDIPTCAAALMTRKAAIWGSACSADMIFAIDAMDPKLAMKATRGFQVVDKPVEFGMVSWGGVFGIPKGIAPEQMDAAKKWTGWLWGVPYLEGRGVVGYPGKFVCASPDANKIILDKLKYPAEWFGLDWAGETGVNSFNISDVLFPDHLPVIADGLNRIIEGKTLDVDALLKSLDDISVRLAA